jgi:hypothetical protein
MSIDRNARARLGARLRADTRLTPTARLVAHAALFGCMDARTGRCQAYRARIAKEAGCCERSVTRGTDALQEAGYVTVVPTWGTRRRQESGRWFRPRGPNVIEWVLPADFLRDRMSAEPSPIIIKESPAPLPEGLARALARFGHAVVDAAGLPT